MKLRRVTVIAGIGSVVGEAFPGHASFLDVAVYDATGLSQTKGVRKTSVRLVWPGQRDPNGVGAEGPFGTQRLLL